MIIRSAEAVTIGHPDMMCDIVADAILDEYIRNDPEARVGCEVLVAKTMLVIAGEITSHYKQDLAQTARRVLSDIGYCHDFHGLSHNTCNILISISEQSLPIQAAVAGAARRGNTGRTGAGDQAVISGYAEKNDYGLIPAEFYFARILANALSDLRLDGTLEYLWPDGKTLVSLVFEDNKPIWIHTISISAQHDPSTTRRRLRNDLIETAIHARLPRSMITRKTKIFINPPTGSFSCGGPWADTGLTGRKIAQSTYGSRIPYGGGALAGKDPTKIDRCGAYGTRFVARNLVRTGLCEKVVVTASYLLGLEEPIALEIDALGTASVSKTVLTDAARSILPLAPHEIITRLQLKRPIYQNSTRRGCYGMEPSLPWETNSPFE